MAVQKKSNSAHVKDDRNGTYLVVLCVILTYIMEYPVLSSNVDNNYVNGLPVD